MDRPQPVSPELVSDLKICARSTAILAAIVWSVISCDAGFGLTTICGSSISPPARATFPRLVVEFAREIGATVTIDAVDLQASTIAIAAELEQRVSRDPLSLRGHSLVSARNGPTTSCSSRSRCTIFRGGRDRASPPLRSNFRGAKSWWPTCAGAGRRSLASICLTTLVFREAMTRNDARVSMERAFSFRELANLATVAGWHNFGHRRFRFARQAIWLERAPRE